VLATVVSRAGSDPSNVSETSDCTEDRREESSSGSSIVAIGKSGSVILGSIGMSGDGLLSESERTKGPGSIGGASGKPSSARASNASASGEGAFCGGAYCGRSFDGEVSCERASSG
jgi:hypothetical protein